MADVRALLRNERASRRIAHPAASYTEGGKLLCNICALQIKNESQWEIHIKSPQHMLLAQRARDSAPQGKKRKAGDDADETNKRVKSLPDTFLSQDSSDPDTDLGPAEEVEAGPDIDAIIPDQPTPVQNPTINPPVLTATVANVDEDEWAAFEADIAATQQLPPPIHAAATISAAPLSAEEIAAQAREEQSTQRERRDAELEAEKEEADEALLNEFDEMEELEDRLRRLREKREALRKTRQGDDELLPDVPDSIPTASNGAATVNLDEEDDEDEDDEDEDFDDWKFGAN